MTNDHNKERESLLTRKLNRRIWWLEHRKTIILTIVSVLGAAIFALSFGFLFRL